MSRPEIPNVALLVDTSTGWGRRLIRGVLSYANKHGPWDVWLEPRGQEEQQRLPIGWNGQGVIARVSTRAIAERLKHCGCPVVNVSAIQIRGHRFPCVTTDAEAPARMAVAHFCDRGIQQLGYVGLTHRSYSVERQRAFAQACAEAHCECNVYVPEGGRSGTAWESQVRSLRRWIRKIEKPVGILTWGVRRGLDVTSAAQHCSLKIPDEVAVLCGDDDELLCEAVMPSLSGIMVASRQIGHEAAAMLDRLISGERLKQQQVYVKPTGINSRASTDLLALDDPDVVAAVRFIRKNADRAIRVADVAASVAVARRSLERRFQRALRRTVGDEISRVHLERAKELLIETDLPIPQVADASGYGSPEYLASVFRREVGQTPLKYRTRIRGR